MWPNLTEPDSLAPLSNSTQISWNYCNIDHTVREEIGHTSNQSSWRHFSTDSQRVALFLGSSELIVHFGDCQCIQVDLGMTQAVWLGVQALPKQILALSLTVLMLLHDLDKVLLLKLSMRHTGSSIDWYWGYDGFWGKEMGPMLTYSGIWVLLLNISSGPFREILPRCLGSKWFQQRDICYSEPEELSCPLLIEY